MPEGNSASSASQCEGVRVDEKIAVNCWKEEASGGRLSKVMPSFFIMTFCAWSTGFVARCRDFLASLSLRLMAGGSCGVRARRRGGVEARTVGEAALQTAAAKSEMTFLTGELTPGESSKGGAS